MPLCIARKNQKANELILFNLTLISETLGIRTVKLKMKEMNLMAGIPEIQ